MSFWLQWTLAALLAGPGDESGANTRFTLDASAEADFERRGAASGLGDLSGDEAHPAQQEEQKPQQPQEHPPQGAPQSQALVDFGWMELYPRAGVAIFSGKYHINASPCLEIEARAPIPWLSPASNPQGDYFGAFAQLNFAMITRTIVPKLAKASGLMTSLALGLDYTIFRDDTWLLVARLGFQYTNYGGVTDLKDGGQAVVGLTTGVNLSRSILLTLTPELVYAKTGDYIMMGLVGMAVEF
jgi:hypothetical protein